MQSLVGVKPSFQGLIDQLFLQTDYRMAELGWLPPDQRAAARQAFEDAGLRDLELGPGEPERDEQKLFTRRMAILSEALTPAELEEYRLRCSPAAKELREIESAHGN